MDAVESWEDQYVFLSIITVAEVEFGLSLPHRLDPDLVQEVRKGLSMFPVLEIDRHVAEPYGAMRSWLVQKYAPPQKRRLRSLAQLADPVTNLALGVQENDLWLASQALASDAVLVTTDRMTHIRKAARAIGLELLVSNAMPEASEENEEAEEDES